jgi:hypothetical protein
MIHLSRSGLRLDASEADLDALAAQFAARHVIQLPSFLDRGLGSLLDERLSRAPFCARIENGLEIEDALDDANLAALCHFLLNDRRLLTLIDRLTGCGPIASFTGRVYRRRAPTRPGEHYYPWHDDVSEDRRVAISINLGCTPYAGGHLQLRDAQTQAMLAEIANLGRHDAMLFRVSPALQHRVTPVTGQAARTVLTGWFRGDSQKN